MLKDNVTFIGRKRSLNIALFLLIFGSAVCVNKELQAGQHLRVSATLTSNVQGSMNKTNLL